MLWPTVLRSLKDCCWSARNAGSPISTEDTTCAETNRAPISNIARIENLFARINCPWGLIWWIGHCTSVRDESAHIGCAQSVPVGRHERGTIERRAAVQNDRCHIGIAHLVQRVALRKCMRLYFRSEEHTSELQSLRH